MGFSSVYKVLREVFPQVDVRLLKAAAIEHSKDANIAVEFILSDVLPSISKQSIPADTPIGSREHSDECQEQGLLPKHQPGVEEANAGSCSKFGLVQAEGTATIHVQSGILADSSLLDEDLPNSSLSSKLYDANGYLDKMHGNTNSEECDDLHTFERINVKNKPVQMSQSSSVTLFQDINDDSNKLHPRLELFNGSDSSKCDTVNHEKGHLPDSLGWRLEPEINLDQFLHLSSASGSRSPCYDSNADLGHSSGAMAPEFKTNSDGTDHLECLGSIDDALPLANSMVLETSCHVHGHVLDALESTGPSEYYSGITATEIEKPKSIVSVDTLHEEDKSSGEVIDAGEEATLSHSVTRSGQACRIDLLENLMEEANNSKKTLFLDVESIIELMHEVERQEKAAEQARKEALGGGVNILARVEEMKQMLQHAKGANDMHAGEVYGEKAILATEARELQGRLLSLSEERDTSLAILNEMRLALEARLAAAAEEKEAAEQEKVEKENSAQNALAEQECIMDRVVKESKMLQQEAEENSKLREFLIERGRLVDTLQGEIAVICQDVRLLKEKFDKRVPLSESLSSSQTSRILASSSSSLKSMASNRVAGQGATLENPNNMSPTSSISHTPKSSHGSDRDGDDQESFALQGCQGDAAGRCVQKGRWDDEWDILDYCGEVPPVSAK